MIRTFFCTFIILLYTSVSAQVVFNGHLYDVGTQNDVVGARVELLNRNQEISTNSFGDFVLKYENSDDLNFQFFNNSMIWSGDKKFTIKIIGLDGKNLYQENISGGESYLFPRLQTGIYVMTIKEDDRLSSFKILSDGNETVKVDKRGIFHRNSNAQNQYDTLTISKEGYFSREIAVPSKSTVLGIGMLRGSYENLDYFNELIAPLAFDLLSGSPSRSNLGDVQQVKIIYDTRTDLLYYMNSDRFKLHFTFSEQILDFNRGHFYFNQTQYTDNPNRFLYLASLNYYKGIDQYVLQYVSAIEMNCDQIETVYNKILETSFLDKSKLRFFPIESDWELCSSTNIISSEELYKGQIYQGLNEAENYGYLRKISSEELGNTYVGRRNIVLTDGVPNDLPVVAGIITSEFQTPLSHINVLSHSRNIPNMALRGAWDDADINSLLGKLIYLRVKGEGYELREASIGEASKYWESKEPNKVTYLKKNLSYSEISGIEDVDFRFVDRVGGKATNFAELKNMSTLIPTPENAFAIPFYYYDQHMERYGLTQYLEKLISDPLFASDAEFRNNSLEKLRDSIINSSIDPSLVSMVSQKLNNFSEFDAFRFRSSTNAEDLEAFSGAGLYDSYSAKKDHDKKTIERAIKRVWASLWNWRAYEERDYFKIDHLSCAMGILVHRSFPDEDANGVLVTKNLYNSNPGYVINVQHGESSIVFPEPGVIHDQMILFTWSIDPNDEFMLEYLSFSNLPEYEGKRVMTDEEVFEMGRYAKEIKRRFYYNLPHNCNCTFNDFGVDIEFKVDSRVSPRKVYVKQARLYR
ncbi:MAG: hypothetical protein JXR03_13405 [Cyclobacteriaceae bacterium]